ncbi:MAG: CDP-glycerol glycerophosphotransferase family protein [Clostridia bacterium]|nr:CDP-glycerol glycerophosphotransferase family protein [Clostridia bacterium]
MIKNIKKLLKKSACIIFYVLRVFPLKNNRVLFSCFQGEGYGDNLKPIADKLLDDENIEIIWLVNKHFDDMPSKIKQVDNHSFKRFYYLATAKVWVNNERFSIYVRKRKGQVYIQTWHSSLRLKKIEGDAAEFLPKSYIECAKNDSKMADYIPCGCEFSKKTYRESFWYDGPILMCGTPKFDIYFDEKECRKIKENLAEKYGVGNKKVILYAPTFRRADKHFTGTLDFNKFASELLPGDEYVVLVRLHPSVPATFSTGKNVINVTDYPNMQDLIIWCDCLITDYSGCCFDTLVHKKPCILYVPDLEEYLANERDLYFDFDELPFEKVKSPEDLAKTITEFDKEKYSQKVEEFSEKIGFAETGKAAEYLGAMIKEITGNEKV